MLMNQFPDEIKNKIFLFLSNPCADMMKDEFSKCGCIVEGEWIDCIQHFHAWDDRDYFIDRYFDDINVKCYWCDARLLNKKQRCTFERHIYCKDCFDERIHDLSYCCLPLASSSSCFY